MSEKTPFTGDSRVALPTELDFIHAGLFYWVCWFGITFCGSVITGQLAMDVGSVLLLMTVNNVNLEAIVESFVNNFRIYPGIMILTLK
jgi:hypothetical protein